MSQKTPKTAVVAFKVEEELADFLNQLRPGANLFSDSVVILDAKSRREVKRLKIGRGADVATSSLLTPSGSRVCVAAFKIALAVPCGPSVL